MCCLTASCSSHAAAASHPLRAAGSMLEQLSRHSLTSVLPSPSPSPRCCWPERAVLQNCKVLDRCTAPKAA